MQIESEYVLIVHTDDDIHIRSVLMEGDLAEAMDLRRYAERHHSRAERVEMITKEEFNARLDRMLSEF
ncbi:hypothetical protein [Paenibacillus mucilaginosus]|uniref:Uncharacterized protein n=3 Tax=Paenibacillus mucilaginosus TaxID=61624 RepID=H6NRD3_9BACL|nr:hypothetical protein [Paenibacillus mucilaginosus]AEI45928.1 hypothetical protein KNP414_07424 [Paenibacillus mucilaginosus KNP414]AFC33568.1 hypothetical protein PM3016_6977 [Paenibacillus mucilaginosus 3016]AFH65890.1 hypothetical protein B2K_35195 [Paenibacillus mucilaginosus K02]MCG7216790.1 hypothetical protein [Paenibacillus mucilaginosus]WDM27281.1 hypothetical protein KCX80_33670 [Paenibacillus mucilaginosus]